MKRLNQSLARLLSLFAALGMLLTAGATFAESRLLPSFPEPEGESCVVPTPDIIRNHMKYLYHHRDETMHEGIRTKKFSLTGCISCHATKDESGKAIPVNAEGQFCQSCHAYAAVKIDCFQCHSTIPEKDADE